MIVGFDYFNTITKHPAIFKMISQIVKDAGGQVHIITAISERSEEALDNYSESVKEFIYNNDIEYDAIRIFTFVDPTEIPGKKLENAKDLGVEYFFDDRGDVCNLLEVNGIQVCRVK